ncbi:hypothetical protein SAMN05443287_101663 [Micromonospora phaseoli]|uniref:Uncharacterized protein n=1 Tax=Micromonospora phaseoli TaxID=1144548 RepID=A0A1H6SG91_9ACTN|nr:hypothetical protein CLV64_101663 [Micromonospora phaseoli]SEI65896.1 hypothetical protein SAMN05443287_101663 [Micromonospora phaseoli]
MMLTVFGPGSRLAESTTVRRAASDTAPANTHEAING